MTEYRHSAHVVFDLKYHMIWCRKYRYKILKGRVAERARDLNRQICQAREVVIIRGAVSPDHIHLLLAAPPMLGACPRISRAVPRKRRCRVARIYAHSVESVGQLAGSPQQAVQRAISNENHHSALGLRLQGSVNLQDIMCHAQQCPLALNFPQAA